jgi:hypothetical protein
LKILLSLRVNGRRIDVRTGRQINFRFADVQEAERIAGSHLAGFFRGHHVVRQFTNLSGQFWFGPQCGKWFQSSHKK